MCAESDSRGEGFTGELNVRTRVSRDRRRTLDRIFYGFVLSPLGQEVAAAAKSKRGCSSKLMAANATSIRGK
jgi:hypothetical protein